MPKMKEWKLQIYGKVQGVGYRMSVCRFVESSQRPLRGYVRNCDDGHVEILAQGQEEDLQALREFCHRGPERCRVDKVDVEESGRPGPLYDDFSIRR